MFICPFRFEKKQKSTANKGQNEESSDESSDESLDLAELADFNKILENHFRENIKKEFHEKFNKINNIQNEEIDKKLAIMSKQRNAGQLKYLLKKKVNRFKDNIDTIQTQLGKLDGEIELSEKAEPDTTNRFKSAPFGLIGENSKLNEQQTVDENFMKNAFKSMTKLS